MGGRLQYTDLSKMTPINTELTSWGQKKHRSFVGGGGRGQEIAPFDLIAEMHKFKQHKKIYISMKYA